MGAEYRSATTLTEETVNAIAEEINQAKGTIATRTASVKELQDIICKQQSHFVIGDGIALSSVVHWWHPTGT